VLAPRSSSLRKPLLTVLTATWFGSVAAGWSAVLIIRGLLFASNCYHGEPGVSRIRCFVEEDVDFLQTSVACFRIEEVYGWDDEKISVGRQYIPQGSDDKRV